MTVNRHPPDTVISVSGDTAFWRGLEVSDTADITHVDAERFVENGIACHSVSGDWIIQGEPLLWHRVDQTAALINERYFSDLIVGDLTSLDEVLNVGRIHAALLREMTCSQVIFFVLSSSLLRTFVHSHAELQLIERIDGSCYRERYNAGHFMYTNEEIRIDYSFEVSIDTQSGTISVGPS